MPRHPTTVELPDPRTSRGPKPVHPQCPPVVILTTGWLRPTGFPTATIGDNVDGADTRPELRACGPDHHVTDTHIVLTAQHSTGMPL